jgi:hypothetical protein
VNQHRHQPLRIEDHNESLSLIHVVFRRNMPVPANPPIIMTKSALFIEGITSRTVALT